MKQLKPFNTALQNCMAVILTWNRRSVCWYCRSSYQKPANPWRYCSPEYGRMRFTQSEIDQLIADQYKTYIPAGDQIIDVIPQEFTLIIFKTS
jgi:cell division protein FtsA